MHSTNTDYRVGLLCMKSEFKPLRVCRIDIKFYTMEVHSCQWVVDPVYVLGYYDKSGNKNQII